MEQDGIITPEGNGAGNDTPQTFNVKVWTDANGSPIMQEVTLDELQNGYQRQSDYTRKTQELAREREMLQNRQTATVNNEDVEVERYVSNIVDRQVEEKLAWLNKQQQDEQSLQSVIASNPDLKQFEGAIRKIASTDNSAIEDIVVRYWFTSHDKLSKAKQRSIVWWSDRLESDKSKPMNEWTKDDRAKFEALANRSQFR